MAVVLTKCPATASFRCLTPVNAGSTPRPRLTPLVRLPDKGPSTTCPAPAPAEQTYEPAFSDEEEEDAQVKDTAAAPAVATAETHSEGLRPGNEAVGNAAAGASEGITGEHSQLLQSPVFFSLHPFPMQRLRKNMAVLPQKSLKVSSLLGNSHPANAESVDWQAASCSCSTCHVCKIVAPAKSVLHCTRFCSLVLVKSSRFRLVRRL